MMTAVADKQYLHALIFQEEFEEKIGMEIPLGDTPILTLIQEELRNYFEGKLKVFKTPRLGFGTPFQQKVWANLEKIPYGKTVSYAEVASMIARPRAHRAVALANRNNPLAVIVPCHRVIYTGGALGGYRSGLERKKWLLLHEQRGSV